MRICLYALHILFFFICVNHDITKMMMNCLNYTVIIMRATKEEVRDWLSILVSGQVSATMLPEG